MEDENGLLIWKSFLMRKLMRNIILECNGAEMMAMFVKIFYVILSDLRMNLVLTGRNKMHSCQSKKFPAKKCFQQHSIVIFLFNVSNKFYILIDNKTANVSKMWPQIS